MGKKGNLVRMKVEFEHCPLMDSEKHIKNESDLDEMLGDLKLKLFGK